MLRMLGRDGPDRKPELLGWVLTEDEVLEAPLGRVVLFGEALEQFRHQFVEPALLNGIVVVLPVTTGLDQSCNTQQCEVMADGRLALAEPLTQGGDMQLLFPAEEEQDLQAGF